MKKIHISGLILGIATIAAAACLVAGCGESSSDHEHIYSDAWAYDAQSHWHPTTCGHDAKKDKTEHKYTEKVTPPTATATGYTTYTCTCGYSYTDKVTDPDKAPEKDNWQYNGEIHWNAATSATGSAHDYEVSVVDATCSQGGYTLHACKVCNYWYKDGLSSATGQHTYDDSVWEYNESGHWRHATCCSVGTSPLASHNYSVSFSDPECDGTNHTYTITYACKQCGYSYTETQTLSGHPISAQWTSDDDYHYHEALCSHAVDVTDKAEHVFEKGSNDCLVCGKTLSARLQYSYNESADAYTLIGIIGSLEGEDKNVVVPAQYHGKNITAIARGAFKDTNITGLTLPAVITEVPNDLCHGCTELTSVTFNGTVTKIGDFAFMGCSKLNMAIPSSVKTIGFSAFNGCAKLTSALPDGVISIDEYAFKDCTSLETVTIPDTATTVNGQAFKGCTALTTLTVNNAYVSDSAFEGCTALNSVKLDSSVVSIGDASFKGCTALTTLALPESVVHVGVQAFENTGLITTEDGVRYAANVAVGYTQAVSAITLKAGTCGIADEAFKGFTGLASVELADTVKFVGVNAFRSCTKLNYVTFPASVKLISANAFRQSGLISVTIPATVDSIGDNAFYDCASLVSVDVSAKEIGKFAFSYTGTGRTLDHTVKDRPDIAHLTSVTIGEGVLTIGSNAFQYCPIESVTLPSSLTKIGQYAFAQTDLKAITIPANVVEIGEYAFYDCKSLTSATFAATTGWIANGESLAAADLTAANLKKQDEEAYGKVTWTRSV